MFLGKFGYVYHLHSTIPVLDDFEVFDVSPISLSECSVRDIFHELHQLSLELLNNILIQYLSINLNSPDTDSFKNSDSSCGISRSSKLSCDIRSE